MQLAQLMLQRRVISMQRFLIYSSFMYVGCKLFHEVFYRFLTNMQNASKSTPACKSLTGTLRKSPFS